jgi:hypothetical protein
MYDEKIYCWQIMQCGDDPPCPVRKQKISHCWEWMKKNVSIPCKYGLCEECIVYLCKNELSFFSRRDLEQIITWRSVAKKSPT